MPILNHRLPMKHIKGTDTSASTISANTMLNGFTSHDSNGNKITGTIATYDGIVSGGLIIVPTEPTMYLYGHEATEGENADITIDGIDYVGAVLPALPEWDKETYPYAVIVNGGYYAELFAYKTDGYVYTGQYYNKRYASNSTEDALMFFIYTIDEGATWDEPKTVAHDYINSQGLPIWSNFDIPNNDDGSVYLSASEPIPVYE